MIFVDTNYFLCFLLKDVDDHHRIALKLFEEAATGKLRLFTSLIVIFEIYWVLSSFYQKDKVAVVDTLREVLKMEYVGFAERDSFEEALAVFEKHPIDLEDAYNLVFAKNGKAEGFKTFDRKIATLFGKNNPAVK